MFRNRKLKGIKIVRDRVEELGGGLEKGRFLGFGFWDSGKEGFGYSYRLR